MNKVVQLVLVLNLQHISTEPGISTVLVLNLQQKHSFDYKSAQLPLQISNNTY